ncbi:TonB-dependent receptor [hydrothermal vent metagenome]|uniref:TonB-dependent receptor n=1 Tax=hydrothermal vent metagenome TaxID=652676 RepID=A0A160TN35_9ZZZZ
MTIIAAPAHAQDAAQAAPSTAEEDIVVTGIRGSLQRNLDIKRDSIGVVDAISAEDIGKFPDSNVAASLQRLPGVSIQRDGARGEATGITVRGFGGDFNETLFDGRRISTATGGRSVDFSTVGADFVGQLNVMKTPDVTVGANSIGATVNILFPKPFDHPGMRLAATVSGSWQEDAKKVVPTGGILFSDTFADDTFGILADVAYARHDTQTNQAYINGFGFGYFAPCQLAGSTAATCSPTTNTTAPASQQTTVRGAFEQQYGLNQLYTKDERIDGRLALQWHPSDAVMVTLDNNFSRQTVNQDSFGFGIWFNQGSLRNVVLDGNGVPTNFTQAGTQTDFNATTNSNVLQTNQTGLNVKWDVSDNFSVEADGSYSKSWRNPDGRVNSRNGDVGYGFGIGPSLGIVIDGDSKNKIPTLNNYGVNGDESRWADTSVIGSHVTVNTANKNTDVIKQGRLTGQWKQDGFSIKFGGSYLEDQFKLQTSDTFANNFWQAYAGYGPPSGGTTGVLLPASLFTGQVSTANFLPGYSGNLPSPLLKYSAADYQAYLTSLGNPQTKRIPGFNYLDPQVGPNFTGTFDVKLNPASVQVITEKTWAAFVRASFETEIAGMKFNFNAGAREEVTHITSNGIGQVPLTLTQGIGDPTLLSVGFSPSQPVSTKSSYAYFLPSIDMKLNITDKFDIRFDASRTLTRPNLSFLTPVLNVGSGQRVGAFTATGGNPNLRPYLSDNFDLTAEWYYQRNSYFAVDLFVKNVSNFIVAGVTRQPINNVIDPTTGLPAQFSVSARVNGPDATVRGIEIAWQQVFGNSGFGFSANGTFVNTNKPYNPNDFTQTGFAVTGLANSANFVGFYDKNGFQARMAVNWRDDYLLQFGQAQNNGKFGAEPTFVNQSTQIDFSTSYDLTKQFTIFGEALNLTNETYSTRGRYKNQLLSAFGYGRRITAGVRFHY